MPKELISIRTNQSRIMTARGAMTSPFDMRVEGEKLQARRPFDVDWVDIPGFDPDATTMKDVARQLRAFEGARDDDGRLLVLEL